MRRRQAHRAADVRAEVKRRVPRDGCCGRARARARGIAVESPRIARDAVQAGKPGGQHAVVGHGGLAEEHAAGLAHARRGRRVRGLRRGILVGARTDRRRVAARIDVLLEGDRHAIERRARLARAPPRLRRVRLGECLVGTHEIHRVDARLPGRDALELRVRHLQRRELAPRVRRGELARRKVVYRGHLPGNIYTRRRRDKNPRALIGTLRHRTCGR